MKTQRGRRLWWLIRLIAWLPLPLAAGLGAILGDLITRVPLRYASAYRVVLINLLATQPGISFDQARVIGRQSLRELGRSFCEFAHVWSRPIDETMARISHIHGEQEYLDACASDRPVLLLSLHLGSWETMNPYLGRQGTNIMYQPHPATLVDELVKQARERSGCRLVPTNNQGIKHGLATLRAGGTLALLADHNPGNRSNPYAPFFGHPVPTPALVAPIEFTVSRDDYIELGGYGERIKRLDDLLNKDDIRAVPWRDHHAWPYDVGHGNDKSDS